MKTSEHLTVSEIYTRKELKAMFKITDSNLNNGVFRPKGHDSIWIFVTKEKSADRTQYVDELIGDTLSWDGQTSGRTDPWIVEHRVNGRELLLFYRESRSEYPGAGFRYEGVFEYVSHMPGHPSHFILRRCT